MFHLAEENICIFVDYASSHVIASKHRGICGQIVASILRYNKMVVISNSSFLILMSFLTNPVVLFKGELASFLPLAIAQSTIGNCIYIYD